MNDLFLGIDTSNYTTSMAVMDQSAKYIQEAQELLSVAQGKRGLRQSEALFQHVTNLPKLMEKLSDSVPNLAARIKAVAATTSPRPVVGSYMPVFLPGVGFGQGISSLLHVPFYALSHQENHIWAGLYNSQGPSKKRFLSLHISGGTTELVLVQIDAAYRVTIDQLGGTKDIHAGQFVDRVGVALGLPFPAGTDLEEMTKKSQKEIIIPSYHKEGQISFSGPETAAIRLIGQEDPADIGYAVFQCIGRTLAKLIRWGKTQTGESQVLIVGGVAANSHIRQILLQRLNSYHLFFASPRYSVDNSVGAAVFCGLAHSGVDFFGNVFPDTCI